MPNPETERLRALLPEAEYERLADAADREGKSVEEALREAVREYARPFDPDDPLFNVEPASGSGEPIDVERLDDYLYGEMLEEEP